MAVFRTEQFSFFQRQKRAVGGKMRTMHYHDHHELYFLVSGKTTYTVGGEVFFLEPGDMVFIPRGVYHQTDNTGTVDLERILLIFSDETVLADYRQCLAPLAREKYLRVPAKNLPHVQGIFARMEAAGADTELCRLYLSELLLLLSRGRQSGAETQMPQTERIVRDAAKYIGENVGEALDLATLAGKYAVSPGYFSKLFRKVAGVGLHDYIAVCRVSAAKKMLEEGSRTVTEVALSCGFNDSAYFAKVFRRMVGVHPLTYKKQAQR